MAGGNRHWNLRQAQDVARINAEHSDREPEEAKRPHRRAVIRRRKGRDTRTNLDPHPTAAPRELTAAERRRVREELRRAS